MGSKKMEDYLDKMIDSLVESDDNVLKAMGIESSQLIEEIESRSFFVLEFDPLTSTGLRDLILANQIEIKGTKKSFRECLFLIHILSLVDKEIANITVSNAALVLKFFRNIIIKIDKIMKNNKSDPTFKQFFPVIREMIISKMVLLGYAKLGDM